MLNTTVSLQPINPDDLIRKEWTEKAEPPAELIGTMLPYQLEGLGWMLHQEASTMRGGILADEMGMVSHLLYCIVSVQQC
jgi:SNF2 family DNA or RNA helicase